MGIKKRAFILSLAFIILVSVAFATDVFVWKIDGKNPVDIHNLGIISYYNGNTNQAVSLIKSSVELDSSYDKGFYSLGLVYFRESDYKGAIENFEKAVSLQKGNTNYNFDLAVAYVELFREKEKQNAIEINSLGLLRKAISRYESVILINPDFPNAASNLEIVKRVLEEYKTGLKE